MAKIKKAQLGSLIKKGMRVIDPAKDAASARKLVNKLKKTETRFDRKVEKEIAPIRKEIDINKYNDAAPKPVVLTAEQKANNARILKEIKEGKRKNGGTTMKKAQAGRKIVKKPTYKNLRMGVAAASKSEGRDYTEKATKQDSINYVRGFNRGLKKDKETRNDLDEVEKMGRWEGLNTKKTGGPVKKVIKKAKSGAKFDLNKDGKTTFKDVLIGRGVLPKTAKKGAAVKKAKSGTSMKKCRYGCK